MQMRDNISEWLTLTQAAELLGVHPVTLRKWSDKGNIPVHRTEGKHRRYRRDEIELWALTARQSNASGLENVIQHTLSHMRFQIGEGRLEAEPWYQKLDEKARSQYRQSGRVLVQGLTNYIESDGQDANAEASSVGYEYASRGRQYGLNHVEATRAFLFFRNILLEAMISVYEESNIPSGAAWQEMLHKVHAFTDQIMLSLLETYQALGNNHG
jgi:excisionase family DNA binding protein